MTEKSSKTEPTITREQEQLIAEWASLRKAAETSGQLELISDALDIEEKLRELGIDDPWYYIDYSLGESEW